MNFFSGHSNSLIFDKEYIMAYILTMLTSDHFIRLAATSGSLKS